MKRLVAAAAAAVVTLAGAVAGAQSSAPMLLLRPNPEDTVHVDAYLGIEYATVSRQYEEFNVRGLSREPYVLKTADFQISNLSNFDFALDAAATSLLAVGGFTKPQGDTQVDSTTQEAERYAALISYALGKKIKLRTEAHFARLTTYVSPDFESSSSYPVTTYSVPSSGAMTRLHPGGGVGGDTTWYSGGFDVEGSGSFLGLDGGGALGYRYFQLDTLSPYAVKDQSNAPAFQGIVADTFACHAVSVDMRGSRQLFSDLLLQMDFHLVAGYATVSSALLDTASGMCLGEGGTAALVFTQPHWNLTIGAWFDQIAGPMFGGGSTLSQSVAYNSQATGRVQNAAAGSQWNVNGPGESISTLGPFLHLTASF